MKEKKAKEMESRIATDPKFRRLPKTKKNVRVDKDERFKSMFEDKRYQTNSQMDKKGKRLTGLELKNFYNLSSESEEDEESETEENAPGQSKSAKTHGDDEEASEETDDSDEEAGDELQLKTSEDKKVPKAIRKKLKNLTVDYARGEAGLFSESSSDDEESEDGNDEDEDATIEHNWGELDADADRTEEATCRLAACHLDWDKIRACDLMVLFNSFLPATGVIKSVSIYPSEFGKERMKQEEIQGPDLGTDDKEESEEGSKYHMEKLRKYQMDRLKYYYAVVTFNTPGSANTVYTECDGMEYESSGTKIDLRFIPDDMTFEDEPKETCDKLPEKYQPRFFTTTALQQAKVDLTWDETPAERLEVMEKINSGKLDEITDKELEYVVAYSDDNESEAELNEDTLAKYKALLEETEGAAEEKPDGDYEMEITWDTGLEKKTEDLIKQKNAEEKTPFEQLMDKKKEKRKQKKKLRKEQQRQDAESGDDVPSDVDMNNPYFAEEFDKAEFKRKKKKKQTVDETREGDAGLALLLNNEDAEEDVPLTKKNKRKLKKMKKDDKEIEFPVMEDERFAVMATNHLYSIDPDEETASKTKKRKLQS